MPSKASTQQYKDFKRSLGIQNSVLTHGLAYGDECSSLKAFMIQLGTEKTRAIGVIHPEKKSDEEILELHMSGIRGVRVNLCRYHAMEHVPVQKQVLQAHASRILKLSLPWSLTMTTIHPKVWDVLAPFVQSTIVQGGIHLISDHFCLLKASSMLAQSTKIIQLLSRDSTPSWKLSVVATFG